MGIPEEAIEAAAKAFCGTLALSRWEDLGPITQEAYCDKARSALEAAAPFIQAQALRDAVDAFPLETIHAPDNAVVWLWRRADQIAGAER